MIDVDNGFQELSKSDIKALETKEDIDKLKLKNGIVKVVIQGDTCHLLQDKEIISPPDQVIEMTTDEYKILVKNKSKIKKEVNKEKEYIEKGLIITDNLIIEQIQDKEQSKFCVYNNDTKEISYVTEFENYKPISGEEIIKGVIKLPSKTEEYNTDVDLDNEIKKFITKWLDIPSDVLQFAIWNIKRSWVYDRFHTLNYLRALGDTGQGKSRFLDTLGAIHYKPIATSGATTAAPIFRIIEKWHGTLIMDEADFQKSDESQDIIKIINQGYEKDKWIMRCDQNDASKIAFFDPFCPKIIATRKPFDDKAVESRCITQVMTGTARQDIPYNINEDFYSESLRLRNMLLLWRFRNYFTIQPNIIPEGFDFSNLEPRVKQVISSFVSLFAGDLNQLNLFKDYILAYQENLITERQNSFDGTVVEALFNLINESEYIIEEMNISTQDIIEKGQITDFKGNLIRPKSISTILKSLGFGKTIVKKVEGKSKRCIPLQKEHLDNLFTRYGFRLRSYAVTKVTLYTESLTQKKEIAENVNQYNNNTISKNIACPPIQRNFRNCVTDMSEKVTEEETIIPTSFSKSLITYHKCTAEGCNEVECNLDSHNVPYCQKHWEEMALK